MHKNGRSVLVPLISLLFVCSSIGVIPARAASENISVTKISLDKNVYSSSNSFLMHMTVDAGALNIYNIRAVWAPKYYQGDIKRPFGPTFQCNYFSLAGKDQELSTSIHAGDIDIICEPFADLPLQSYYLQQLVISSTRCDVITFSTLSWPCQGAENGVKLTYNVSMQGEGASVRYIPQAFISRPSPGLSESVSLTPFQNIPSLSLNKSEPFAGPEISFAEILQDRIVMRYSIPPASSVSGQQIVCAWGGNQGSIFSSVTSPLNQRTYTTVSFVGLKPGSDLRITGKCTDLDQQLKEFDFSVGTSKPKGPSTPILSLTNTTDGFAYVAIANYISTYTYSVDAGTEKYTLTGPTIKLDSLKPATSYQLKVTVLDSFGQKNVSELFEFKTLSPVKTIYCVKGKLTKKISGPSPKCPSGYKKR